MGECRVIGCGKEARDAFVGVCLSHIQDWEYYWARITDGRRPPILEDFRKWLDTKNRELFRELLGGG